MQAGNIQKGIYLLLKQSTDLSPLVRTLPSLASQFLGLSCLTGCALGPLLQDWTSRHKTHAQATGARDYDCKTQSKAKHGAVMHWKRAVLQSHGFSNSLEGVNKISIT